MDFPLVSLRKTEKYAKLKAATPAQDHIVAEMPHCFMQIGRIFSITKTKQLQITMAMEAALARI